MLALQLLGSVDLRDAGRDVSPVLRRPKSVALLAYLAVARPRGFHRRDTLLALFWPDLDQPHARNSLRQTIHSLRRVLGSQTLVSRGEEELGVDRARLWCDIEQFDKDLDAGDAKSAVSLYRGALLNGFHMPGGSEFEHWLDQERKYLAKRALGATLGLSKDAERSGDVVAATYWARRATEIEPYDESAFRRLLRLLDHVGRRADAVREYQEFADRLALDLDVAPSPETRRLMESIRARVEPGLFHSTGRVISDPVAGPNQGADSAAKTARASASVRSVLSRSLGVFQAVLARVNASIRSIQRPKNAASSEERTGRSPTVT